MPDVGACRICSGELRLRVRGTGGPATPEAMSPSCHEPGRHGDLLACVECGTVQQPTLPSGAALHDLYRDMADPVYMREEDGRRRTAERLLDLIGRQVPRGRLLDVGCGHGLLLDEARRRGHEVVGVELSRDGAAHATRHLGLDVRLQPFEDFDDPDGFDAIVMADVIEHFDDPVAALDHATALLRPGGVICVVTPDPASLTARALGARWWGYLLAHTFLFPHATLLELLQARGLVVVADIPLVRSFSAGYWVRGLGERLGPAATAAAALADRIPEGAQLRLPLGDERVVVVRRIEVRRAPEPRFTDRAAGPRTSLVIAARDAAVQLPGLVAALPGDAVDRALLVDDGGVDSTTVFALAHGIDAIRHPVRRGPGAARKTGLVAALRDGADVVAFLDAEDLEAARRLPEILAPLRSGGADLVRDAGGRACGATARLLRSIAFLRADDGRAFDEEVTAAAVARGGRIADVGVGAGGNQTGAEQRLHGLRRELAGRLGHDALTTRRPASPI